MSQSSEFDLIARYFKPLTLKRAEAFDLANDTAALPVPAGMQAVVSTDMLIEGRHFFAGTPPDIIARKALRANLSDLTASGATPLCYQMALALPDALAQNDVWLSAFTNALLEDQHAGQFYCSGGDTTRAGEDLIISLSVFGLVPHGRTILRSTAKAGDYLIVTGEIGHGFAAFQQGRSIAPPWRTPIAPIIQRFAQAAIDISDGLLADTAHLAKESGLSLYLDYDHVPLCPDTPRMEAVCGGDDYEIALAVSPDDLEACLSALQTAGCAARAIGRFLAPTNTPPLILQDQNGNTLPLPKSLGWQHF